MGFSFLGRKLVNGLSKLNLDSGLGRFNDEFVDPAIESIDKVWTAQPKS